MAAGVMAILLGFVGTLAALVASIPVAVTGGLAIYLFGVIGMQGIALIQSEKVNLFEPRQLAVGATILICGIGGNMTLKDGLFPEGKKGSHGKLDLPQRRRSHENPTRIVLGKEDCVRV